MRRAHRTAFLLGTGLALMLAGTAAAAEAPTEVGELVITAKLEETLPAELSQYGNRLDVVDAGQLKRGGFDDASQALSTLVPGLYLAQRNGPFSYVDASLQGSRGSEILYLIDGVRISNRLYNSTPPLDTVPSHMIDRIEVLEGGQSLFYGTQGVAGVINIVTRPFTKDWTGDIEAGLDTNKGLTVNGFASGSIGDHRFVIFASQDQARGFQPFRTADYQPSGTDRHRGYRLTNIGAKYAYDISPDLRFSASYTHTVGFVDFDSPFRIARAVNQRDEDIATAKVDWTPSQTVQFFLKGYYHNWDSHYDEFDSDLPNPPVHVDDHEFWGFWDYGVNAVAKLVPTKGVEGYLGYDYQAYWGRDDVLLIADQTEHTHAVFGQIRITPELLPRTHLAAGVRYNDPSAGQNATVWNVSGQFDLTDEIFVRGTGGTSFRLPDAESLFAQDPINNGEVGNPNLRPEHSTNLNASIGIHHRMPGGVLNAEVIGFWRTTKDLIDLSGPTPDPDVFTFINLPDKVKVRGFELTASAELDPGLSLTASYTHARAHMEGSSDQITAIPKDIAQGGIDYHPANLPFGGSAVANWVGSVFDNVPNGIGRVDHGHYVVVDLNAYMKFGHNLRHRISVRLENAFNEDYSTAVRRAFDDSTGAPYAYGFRGEPRTAHVKYDYSF